MRRQWCARSLARTAPLNAVPVSHSRRCQSQHSTDGAAPRSELDETVRTSFPVPGRRTETHGLRGPPSALDQMVEDLHTLNKEQWQSHLRTRVTASADTVARVVAQTHQDAKVDREVAKPTAPDLAVPSLDSVTTMRSTSERTAARASAVPPPPPSWTTTLELENTAAADRAVDTSIALGAADMAAVAFTLEELDEHLFSTSDTAPEPASAAAAGTTSSPPLSDSGSVQPEAAAAVDEALPPPPPQPPSHPAPPATSARPVPGHPTAHTVDDATVPPPPSPPPPPPPAPVARAEPNTTAAAAPIVTAAAPPSTVEDSSAPSPGTAPRIAVVCPAQPPPLPPVTTDVVRTTPEARPCLSLGCNEAGERLVRLVASPTSLRALVQELQAVFDEVEATLPDDGPERALECVHLQVAETLRTRVEDKVVTEHLFFDVADAATAEVALTPLERLHLNAAKEALFQRLARAPQRGWQLVSHLHKGVIARDFGAELLFCSHRIDLTRARGGIVSVGFPSLGLGVFPGAHAVRAFAHRLEALSGAELLTLLETCQVPAGQMRAVLGSRRGDAKSCPAAPPVVTPSLAIRATAHVLLTLHRQDESTTGFNRLLAASPEGPLSEGTSLGESGRTSAAVSPSSLFDRVTRLVRSVVAVTPSEGETYLPPSASSLAEWWERYCELCTDSTACEACGDALLSAARSTEATNGRRVFLDVNRHMGLADYAQGSTSAVQDDAQRWLFVTADRFPPDAEAPGKVCDAWASKVTSAAAEAPLLLFVSRDYPAAMAVQVLATVHANDKAAEPGRYVAVLAGQLGETAECASVTPLSVTLTPAGVPGGRGVEEQLLMDGAARTRPDRARDARLLDSLVEVSVRAPAGIAPDQLSAAVAATVDYLRQRRVPYTVGTSGCAGLRLAIALSDAVMSVLRTADAVGAVDAHLADTLRFSRRPMAVVTRHFGFRSTSFDEAHRRFPRETEKLTTNAIFTLSKRIRRGTEGNSTAAPPPRSELDWATESVLLKLIDAACKLLVEGEVRSGSDMDLLSIAALSLHTTSGGLLTVAQQRFGGATGVLEIAERHAEGDADVVSMPLSAPTRQLLEHMTACDYSFQQLTEERLAQFRRSHASA